MAIHQYFDIHHGMMELVDSTNHHPALKMAHFLQLNSIAGIKKQKNNHCLIQVWLPLTGHCRWGRAYRPEVQVATA